MKTRSFLLLSHASLALSLLSQANTSFITELVVSLMANQEEYLFRTLPNNGASISIMLLTFLSKDHIINGESSKTNGGYNGWALHYYQK
jgi:hypothetical protein